MDIDVSCLIVYHFIVMSFMFDDGCHLDGILYLMVDIVLMSDGRCHFDVISCLMVDVILMLYHV